jgi:hypothetical protein
MVADLPRALASVLSALEGDQLGYVVYRDPKSNHRVVILIEGPANVAALETALRNAGAEATAPGAGHDFILRSSAPSDERDHYVIHMESGSGTSAIANLLWRAATNEGAAAARHSVERGS